MDDAIERCAAALGVAPLREDEETLLLDCARDVAHGTQRRNAPLAAFLLGVAVGGADIDRATVLGDAVSRIRAVVAATEPPDPPAG